MSDPQAPSPTAARLDPVAYRLDFPALHQQVHGRGLVYLDNAATTQKPGAVIDALVRYYSEDNANVHRGVHLLSERATAAYERARRSIARFLNARRPEEIVFVRGTTEAINLVAATFGRRRLGEGDEIVVSTFEHHSNIVPWQMICEEKKARLRVVPMTPEGEIDLAAYERTLNGRTRLVAMVHVSNALGTVNPVKRIVEMAHARAIPVLLDGAQAVAHMAVDVQQIDADFYAFSGHKLFGPTGIGVLYGKQEFLDTMPPYQGGGDMIRSVSFERTLYNVPPYRFEAGTPNIAGAVGLAEAIAYVERVGLERMARHEHELLEHADGLLREIPGLRLYGPPVGRKAAIISFTLGDIHPHDMGTILNQEGVAVRTGHHCCQPLMHALGVDATCRASLAFYNTFDEMDALAAAVARAREVFR
jgi:cysteine desulfurase/selenocysteine lyase